MKRFAIIYDKTEYYSYMVRAMCEALRDLGQEAMGFYRDDPYETFQPTDVFSINIKRQYLKDIHKARYHIWVQDMPPIGERDFKFDRVWMMVDRWRRPGHDEDGYLPPGTDYGKFYGQKPPIRYDVCLSGFLPLTPNDHRFIRTVLGSHLVDICDRNGWKLRFVGDNWVHHPAFAKYAEPSVSPGQALADRYLWSRINIHQNEDTHIHPRVLECFACGGFCVGLENGHERDLEGDMRYLPIAGWTGLEGFLFRHLNGEAEPKRTSEHLSKYIRENYTWKKALERIL